VNMTFGHAATMTNNLSNVKTSDARLRQDICHAILPGMDIDKKPFGDIAIRLRWHRDLLGLTQKEYAEKIGQKRATINNWESGDYRLSLDGALALRKAYGLSLDFMYEGIADALPMTLRNAWLERP
jgi:DNA-binding XRE family transcriptional regulator